MALVDRGHTGEDHLRGTVGKQRLNLDGSEERTVRSGERTVTQCDLVDTVRNVDGVTTANEAEQIQRAGRLVGKGALEHHNRHVLGELADALGQHAQRRRVGVQAVIGRVTGDDTDPAAGRDRMFDRKAEAAIRLGQSCRSSNADQKSEPTAGSHSR
ncbi:hypothetical protein ACU4GD_14335 [Cupriavidus basilensis]